MQLRIRGREQERRNNDRRGKQQKRPGSETAEQHNRVRRIQLPTGENDGIWSLQQSQVCSSFSYWSKSRHQNHQQREDERHGRERCAIFLNIRVTLFRDPHFMFTPSHCYPLHVV